MEKTFFVEYEEKERDLYKQDYTKSINTFKCLQNKKIICLINFNETKECCSSIAIRVYEIFRRKV